MGHHWVPWQRLLGATLGLLILLKGVVLFQSWRAVKQSFSMPGLFLFMTIWPGMDPAPLHERKTADPMAWRVILHGFVWIVNGLFLMVGLAWNASRLDKEMLGWAGVFAFLMMIHLGFCNVLAGFLRFKGWHVHRLFDQPFQSKSLGDFWGRRWNLAFVEMDRILFIKPLRRWFGLRGAILGVFLISGFLHEMALSYPVQAGWGMPLSYFTLHGLLVLLEAHFFKMTRWPGVFARLWTWFWVIIPLPLLFHTPFRDGLIVPFFQNLNHL